MATPILTLQNDDVVAMCLLTEQGEFDDPAIVYPMKSVEDREDEGGEPGDV